MRAFSFGVENNGFEPLTLLHAFIPTKKRVCHEFMIHSFLLCSVL